MAEKYLRSEDYIDAPVTPNYFKMYKAKFVFLIRKFFSQKQYIFAASLYIICSMSEQVILDIPRIFRNSNFIRLKIILYFIFAFRGFLERRYY